MMVPPIDGFEPLGYLPSPDVLAVRLAAGLTFSPLEALRKLHTADMLVSTIRRVFRDAFGFLPSVAVVGDLITAVLDEGPTVTVCRPFAERICAEAVSAEFPIDWSSSE